MSRAALFVFDRVETVELVSSRHFIGEKATCTRYDGEKIELSSKVQVPESLLFSVSLIVSYWL